MKKIIGIIAPDIQLKDNIEELFNEDVEKGEIIIEVLDGDRFKEQAKSLQARGAKAIIARSGVYDGIKEIVKVPVVSLMITLSEVLEAINKASKFSKNIVFVLRDHVYFNYEEWKDILNTKVVIEEFHDKEEIEPIVRKYLPHKNETVIIGGGIACHLGRKLGFDTVFLNARKEAIFDTINHTKALVKGLYEEKQKNQLAKTVLHNVHDAVVAIDSEGKIITYNIRAQELLKKDSNEVINERLIDKLPELYFMMKVLKEEKNIFGKVIFLKDLVITVNASLLTIDGEINGVLCTFKDITRLQKLEQSARYQLSKRGLTAKFNFKDIITESTVMEKIIEKAKKIGETDFTTLIYGESGTGKEVMAQSMHNISSRNTSPFVAVNCAALSESLLESELFGYEEGAFTGAKKGGKPGLFEMAHGGTIFLDEINSISLKLQAKLLRVLEQKEVRRLGSDYVIPLDVRIIAAANEELKNEVAEGSFRPDLFYRLNILELTVPPLRDRKEDIIPLFNFFVENNSQANLHKKSKITKGQEAKLKNHSWQGNVRELRNIAYRYCILGDIDIENYEKSNSTSSEVKEQESIIDLKEINQMVEEKIINMLLSQGKTKTEIAKILGISRTALWKKLKS